ncbi:hypothetical protein [Streptomyces sp. NBC_00151]|nr:hypothetical protein [Streptomyces sp. NBC_00151]WRZ36960.1 hypothetical protein OG915_02080 [Streptomyces sp. NBC_00151]
MAALAAGRGCRLPQASGQRPVEDERPYAVDGLQCEARLLHEVRAGTN